MMDEYHAHFNKFWNMKKIFRIIEEYEENNVYENIIRKRFFAMLFDNI